MPRIALNGGTYHARSVIAGAQRCVNLIPEPTPQQEGEPSHMACYPTAGLSLIQTMPQGPVRGIRQVTTGATYVVAGSGVYELGLAGGAPTLLGSITPGLTTPVSMCDNGLDLVIVDGSANGWQVTLAGNVFAQIIDPSGLFRGADRVDYLDTYFLFNVPNTPQFICSDSLAVTFTALNFANKEAFSDELVAVAVAKREVMLIGSRTTEVWYDSGGGGSSGAFTGTLSDGTSIASPLAGNTFPFESIQGVFIDQGCCAKYSVAVVNNSVLWLTQDRQGVGIVVEASGYVAERVSTYAIEQAIAGYATITDAIGWTYQIAGHTCYVLSFPTADATWVYDISTKLWHEWCWLDTSGYEHRHRGMCSFSATGIVLVGDWQNGNLYKLDTTNFTDAGAPIKRERGFPHIEGDDGNRMVFNQFLANMDTGTYAASSSAAEPQIYLSWSDDRGHSWSNPVGQSMGAAGEYLTQPQWQRLGLSRSRVFRLEWSVAADTALLGAFVDAMPARS